MALTIERTYHSKPLDNKTNFENGGKQLHKVFSKWSKERKANRARK